MENLFNALRPDSGMDKDHQQRIKDKVFGPTSFYVTEIRPLASLKLVNLNSPSASNQDLVAFSVLVSTRSSTSRQSGLHIGLSRLRAVLTGSKTSTLQVRGNLRAPREEVFDKVCQNLEKEFGES